MKKGTWVVCAAAAGMLAVMPAGQMTEAAGLNVQTAVTQQGQMQLSYPKLYADTESATQKMNDDIQKQLAPMQADYTAGKLQAFHVTYKVTYSDAQRVSLVLHTYWVRQGSSLMEYKDLGVVYNKSTGDRLALSDVLAQVPTADQIQQKLTEGPYKAYDAEGEHSLFYFKKSDTVKTVSDDFILTQEGTVSLIYNPYVFEGMARPVYVVLNGENVKA